MSDRQAELKDHAEKCRREALLAMQKAEAATTDEHRTEFLRVAEHWLKLASELNDITKLLAGT
jgi:hypothetical protein